MGNGNACLRTWDLSLRDSCHILDIEKERKEKVVYMGKKDVKKKR